MSLTFLNYFKDQKVKNLWGMIEFKIIEIFERHMGRNKVFRKRFKFFGEVLKKDIQIFSKIT